ncbi:hypothetical protein V3851_22605 [Paenibacillus sp. M1]|uniref:PD-(D/E)XK nuclease superfamily protein n=1 Tax=Paenibacillus haidiansis TaxID=1574488 RepID=A0ABU7VXY6_9BACL
MDNSTVNELEALLQEDLSRLSKTWPGNNQTAIIQLIRIMDYYLLSRIFGDKEAAKRHKYHCYGWGIALNIFFDEKIDSESFSLFPNNDDFFMWADSLLYYCGQLGLVKLVIDHIKTGLGRIEKHNNNKFTIHYDNKIIGVEGIEIKEFFWLNNYLTQMNSNYYDSIAVLAKDIHESMKENVYIWRNYFLGYNTTHEIDRFYLDLSKFELQKTIGFDSFPPNTLFGGLPFELYLDALCILKSFSLRHVGFVTNQLAKGIKVDSANLLQHFMLKSDIVFYLSQAMKIDSVIAEKIIDMLTLNDLNKDHFCSKVDGAIPPFIEISRHHILFSHSGFKAQPVLFMLNELRRRYQKDWDRALDKREEIFRAELYSLFSEERFIKINRPIVIKVLGKVLTDIDGFIYDKETGTLALFQLKWQEPFANSMVERRSRKKNFEKESNHWIMSISNWLVNKSNDELAASFGFKNNDFKDYTRSLLFIIGRNFAHFSGDDFPDERAAWGMWPQLLRLMNENICTEDNLLSWLFNLLKKDSPVEKAKESNRNLKDHIIELKDYQVFINWAHE